jgi:pimeloyl-ACP methyl ester carboxylesterase
VQLHQHRWGTGPTVVLIHGVVLGGREAWRAQRPLADRWTLIAPDRPGHGESPDAAQDFEAEALLIAEQLLGDPIHLVSHSYGAIIATLATAHRLDSVKSLVVVEPPTTRVATDNRAVAEWASELDSLFSDPDGSLPRLLERFFRTACVPLPVPDPLPVPLIRGARALVGARSPTAADLPLAAIADAGIPCMVVSGGHHEVYEAICDVIAASTNAKRAVIPGAAHLVPDTGEAFNRELEDFLLVSEARAPTNPTTRGAR